jgi:hypothetical protein
MLNSGKSYSPKRPLEKPTTSRFEGAWNAAQLTFASFCIKKFFFVILH